MKILKRKIDANKGDFGHVLVIGGDYNMGGAVIMTAEAAYRTGAGRVSVLTRKENLTALLLRLPNAMSVNSELVSEKKWEEIFAGKTVIAIGPGLGKSEWARELFLAAMKKNLPKLIDADALNLLSESEKKFDLKNSVITPHPGEAARLLAVSVDEIQNNRELAAQKLYEKYGAITVLKGHETLVCGDGKILHKSKSGNPGMATAGMGDILSGIIAGLMAQGLEAKDAAISGVEIHGTAGDLIAKKQGQIGMIATDLLPLIPLIINGQAGPNS
jgi:NAD(P)H-hydrate epimerase